MEVRIFKLIFNNIEIARRDMPKIRGYIASNYPEFDELHNHNGDNFIYRYPLVQYKSIDSKPCIIGINEGADILINIEDRLHELNINNEMLEIYEKSITFVKSSYGISDSLLRYKFVSPWMSLNEKNYKKYTDGDKEENTNLLKGILIGNILSMSKRFNYNVDKEIQVYIDLSPCKVNFKNREMIAFKGEFLVNFQIPDFMGIGKSVSRGFGTVELVRDKSFK